jgi:hypothetical protein
MKLLACLAGNPNVAACQFVFAATCYTFHDLGRAGAKSQLAGQHHAHRFFGAIGQREAMANAFTVKVHIGCGDEGHVGNRAGGHGLRTCKNAWTKRLGETPTEAQKR